MLQECVMLSRHPTAAINASSEPTHEESPWLKLSLDLFFSWVQAFSWLYSVCVGDDIEKWSSMTPNSFLYRLSEQSLSWDNTITQLLRREKQCPNGWYLHSCRTPLCAMFRGSVQLFEEIGILSFKVKISAAIIPLKLYMFVFFWEKISSVVKSSFLWWNLSQALSAESFEQKLKKKTVWKPGMS